MLVGPCCRRLLSSILWTRGASSPDKCVRIVSNLRLKGLVASWLFSLFHSPKVIHISGSNPYTQNIIHLWFLLGKRWIFCLDGSFVCLPSILFVNPTFPFIPFPFPFPSPHSPKKKHEWVPLPTCCMELWKPFAKL